MKENPYDEIAQVYDSLFNDAESLYENKVVKDMMAPVKGSVYDIGCGTGLLLEMLDVCPNGYTGIDPSVGMIEEFKRKHPSFSRCLAVTRFEDDLPGALSCDNWVSLFGAVSYVEKDFLKGLQTHGKGLFLMFYDKDYVPVTYKKTGIYVEHSVYDAEELKRMFPDSYVYKFNNYIIVYRL